MFKLIGILARKPGESREEFFQKWEGIHAPMVQSIPGILGFVTNRVTGTISRPDVPPLGVDIDGIVEVWCESHESYNAAISSLQGKDLLKDGASFIGEMDTFIVAPTQFKTPPAP